MFPPLPCLWYFYLLLAQLLSCWSKLHLPHAHPTPPCSNGSLETGIFWVRVSASPFHCLTSYSYTSCPLTFALASPAEFRETAVGHVSRAKREPLRTEQQGRVNRAIKSRFLSWSTQLACSPLSASLIQRIWVAAQRFLITANKSPGAVDAACPEAVIFWEDLNKVL